MALVGLTQATRHICRQFPIFKSTSLNLTSQRRSSVIIRAMDTVKGVVDGVKNVSLTDNSKSKPAKEKKEKKDKKGGDATEDSRPLEVSACGIDS